MKIMAHCQVLLLALLLFPMARVAAQGTREDYQRAEQYLAGNLRHRIYVADVAPHWIAKKNRFWYRKAGTKGRNFCLSTRSKTARALHLTMVRWRPHSPRR